MLPDFTIQENVVLPVLDRFAGFLGRLDQPAIGSIGREAILHASGSGRMAA